MMNTLSKILVIVLSLNFIACASTQTAKLIGSPTDQQILKYEQGRQLFVSHGIKSTIGLNLSMEPIQPEDSFDCYIAVVNNSTEAFNFSTDNIIFQCGQKKIHVYHPEEALLEQKKKTELNFVGISPGDILGLTPQLTDYYERRNQELSEYSKSLLRAQTVLPKSVFGGVVRIAFPSCKNKMELIVIAGDEIHRFEFK